MRFYSTQKQSPEVGLEEAIFRGLPQDNGLFMPMRTRRMPAAFFENLDQKSIADIGFEVSSHLFGKEIGPSDLKNLVEKALDFDAPLVRLNSSNPQSLHYALELWHGPSMAFKDFGARYMAALMSHFLAKKGRKITILVATSGDTGGAVAGGFFKTEDIEVVILYPKNRVSDIQEKQLTTLGQNVRAIEIDGTFDDCQRLVKQAFLDQDLTAKMTLASANSINIARLIPQTFYYFRAFGQLKKLKMTEKPPVFSVPSGNFGNLSAGLWAAKMGLPVTRFVAATNENDSIPAFLKSGKFAPKPTVATISNAMDVGSPSNFPRLEIFAGRTFSKVKKQIFGCAFDDAATQNAVDFLKKQADYEVCPHTAIAFLGLEKMRKESGFDGPGIFLSTAHAAKFEGFLGQMPPRLAVLLEKEKRATAMRVDFLEFKNWLLENA